VHRCSNPSSKRASYIQSTLCGIAAKAVIADLLAGRSKELSKTFSDALVDVEKYREARVQQEQYVRDLDATVRLANLRYNGGITTFLEVLDAQRSRFASNSFSRNRGGWSSSR